MFNTSMYVYPFLNINNLDSPNIHYDITILPSQAARPPKTLMTGVGPNLQPLLPAGFFCDVGDLFDCRA